MASCLRHCWLVVLCTASVHVSVCVVVVVMSFCLKSRSSNIVVRQTSVIHRFIHSFIRLFTALFIHSFRQSFFHLFMFISSSGYSSTELVIVIHGDK